MITGRVTLPLRTVAITGETGAMEVVGVPKETGSVGAGVAEGTMPEPSVLGIGVLSVGVYSKYMPFTN